MLFTVTNPTLCLRPITVADDDTLCCIYSSTRTGEMEKATNWTPEQKQAFLQWQFHAQHVHYQQNYKGAHFWMIEKNGEAIGRLYLHPHYENNSMRIIDIALLPQWRNKGIGKGLLEDIMAFAESRRRTVTIHVESFNPAMRFYQRLGFELVSVTNGVYHLLQWKNTKPVLQ